MHSPEPPNSKVKGSSRSRRRIQGRLKRKKKTSSPPVVIKQLSSSLPDIPTKGRRKKTSRKPISRKYISITKPIEAFEDVEKIDEKSEKLEKRFAKRDQRNLSLSEKEISNSNISLDRKKSLDLQAYSKPLPMHFPLWKIVHHTTVCTHTTRLGYVLVHVGSVSFRSKTDVFRFVVYNPDLLAKKEYKNKTTKASKGSSLPIKDLEELDKKPTGSVILGGGLPCPINFGSGSLNKKARDQCFDNMVKWGRLWRNRAENDLVETTECSFSRAEGPIGVEMDQEVVMYVTEDSPACKLGVQCGWRILKIGSNWVDPQMVVPELQSVLEFDVEDEEDEEDDNIYTLTFAKTTPWSQEIKCLFMRKFLQRVYWRESILSACTLTQKIFTGYLVQREIEVYVSKVKEIAFDTGSEIALDFLSRLCFSAPDSLMSRTMLSNLDDDLHFSIMDALASLAKEHFISMENSGNTQAPAISFLFSRLFNLYPSNRRKFYPGRALNVWFRGVSLDFLQMIQSKIDRNWTTEDVKNKFVLPSTMSTSTNLMVDMATAEQRGPASIFISHAWRNRYFDLVEACKKYPTDFFFNDIIAIQQHEMKSDEMIQDLQALPLIISYSSCCLLISDMKLGPLRRIWCLFELYHCLVTTESKLLVEFTSEGLDDDSDTGLWDASKEIEDRINSIDVTQSNATVEEDKVRILSEIEAKVPGGIEQFNIQLIAALKIEWQKNIREQWGWRMMETVGRAVRKVGVLEKEVVTLEKEVSSLKGTLATVLARLDELAK